MTKKKPFEQSLKSTAEEKEIPFTSQQTFPHEKYQTVRIRPMDFKKIKKYAYKNDMTMVDVISLAINSLNVELDDE